MSPGLDWEAMNFEACSKESNLALPNMNFILMAVAQRQVREIRIINKVQTLNRTKGIIFWRNIITSSENLEVAIEMVISIAEAMTAIGVRYSTFLCDLKVAKTNIKVSARRNLDFKSSFGL
jgi:hypothetical protein